MEKPKSYTSATVGAHGRAPSSDQPPTPAPGGPVRSRNWERDPANKKYSYRTGEDLNELLKKEVAALKEQGFITTVSDMARAWLLAGYEAWCAGDLEVEGTWLNPGTARRTD